MNVGVTLLVALSRFVVFLLQETVTALRYVVWTAEKLVFLDDRSGDVYDD